MKIDIRTKNKEHRLQNAEKRQKTKDKRQKTLDNGNNIFLSFIFVLCSLFFVLPTADAKIYIDISSPAIRKLPITINAKGSTRARKLEWIAKADLEATGMFTFVDPDVPGAEIVATMDVDTTSGLRVVLTINDLIEGSEVLKKRFDASRLLIRPMAHSIANDIYKLATGKQGIFRTKI